MNFNNEIESIKKRLESLQASFIQAQKNQVPITAKTDNSFRKIPQIDNNTNGVSENSDAVIDVADLADENSGSITDLADYVASLEERIAELEGK